MSLDEGSLPADYSSLVSHLHKIAYRIRQPIQGTFELTERCNLSCKMCYISQPESDTNQISRELTYNQWIDISKQAVDNGMIFLLLTGGEVFVRPDFFAIYDDLKKMGLIVSIYTNATLINLEIAERLSENPPNHMSVTLYGASQRTFEHITRRPGSFAACLNGIEALLKNDIKLSLKFTATHQSIRELSHVKKLAKEFNLPLTVGGLISKRRDGKESDWDVCRLTSKEFITLENQDEKSREAIISNSTKLDTNKNRDNLYCNAGMTSFAINSNGQMSVCLDMLQPAIDVITNGFAESWRLVGEFVKGIPSLSSQCNNCDYYEFCPRCPAWSYIESDTYNLPVPYLCMIAKERKEYYEK